MFFDLDGVRLMLEGGTGSAMHYYDVADIDATVDRLRAAGVEIVSEPHVIFSHADDTLGPAGTDEWQAAVRDSEGNLVGLVEQRTSRLNQTSRSSRSWSVSPTRTMPSRS